MESAGGSQEQPDEPMHPLEERALRSRGAPQFSPISSEERDAIADGEPYCFRCGKPASSFYEYVEMGKAGGYVTAWQYVLNEEGTYNPGTNRFACDACYIAIGMPTTPRGWRAP